MRILLADDQNELRALVSRQLELMGHRTVAVANGRDALEALERDTFDAVLLDEEMPVLGAFRWLVRFVIASKSSRLAPS